jgi:hypothetical protein
MKKRDYWFNISWVHEFSDAITKFPVRAVDERQALARGDARMREEGFRGKTLSATFMPEAPVQPGASSVYTFVTGLD